MVQPTDRSLSRFWYTSSTNLRKNIRRATSLEGAGIIDVVPTALYGLGLPVPDDVDGRILIDIFLPSHVESHPPRYSDVPSEMRPSDIALSAEEEEARVSGIKVLFVEPIGGHRGMHYYDFALCASLCGHDVSPTLVTSDETADHNPPRQFDSCFLFREIYGEQSLPKRAANYLYALVQTARLAREGRFAIAHCHYFLIPPADYLFLLALKAMGVKIVITAHDVMPFDAKWYSHPVLRHIYGLADKVIVHAQDNKRWILDQFQVRPSKVAVVRHGNYMPYVDTHCLSREALREKVGVKDFTNVVLFFGQIKKVKGLDHLIRALPDVLSQHPDSVLVIAGQVWKDDFSHYADLISSLGLEKNVIARIEHIPDEDVTAYFESADVVALPYTRVYQSGVLLMACSYGRPVVATSVGGMKEVIQDGVSGYLVPPQDQVGLAQAIARLLSDKERAAEMGSTARRLMEENYSWESVALRTRQIYVAVLGQETRRMPGETLHQ